MALGIPLQQLRLFPLGATCAQHLILYRMVEASPLALPLLILKVLMDTSARDLYPVTSIIELF